MKLWLSIDDFNHETYDRIWRSATDPAQRSVDGSVRRGAEGHAWRRPRVALLAAAVISTGVAIGPTSWVTSQFDVFEPSNAPDMTGAVVVAHLRQHDGSILEIAEKLVSSGSAGQALRCVATRPAAPGDPVAAPSDPLSFAGSAFCTHLDTIAATSEWKSDGSGSLLAHLPDGAVRLELRAGTATWEPTSSDGSWAIFSLPPGSIPDRTSATVVALDAQGTIVDQEPVH